jgi:hypothetical protein
MRGQWISGQLCFSTYRKSAKVRHLEADPSVCCVVLDGTAGALAIWGEAEFGTVPIERWNDVVDGARDDTDIAIPRDTAVRVADRLRTGQRVIVSVAPRSARALDAPS